MSDPQVHVGTHPSGHPNKTAVNAENPIFGRPADPIPAVSIQQAAVVQSEKHPRETVQSPLLHEDVESPVLPSAKNLDAVAEEEAIKEATGHADGSGTDRYGKADDWTQTNGVGLTDDTSSAQTGAEYTHSSGEGSSKITGVAPVALPTQEEADAVVTKATAEVDSRKFATSEKVRFTPESGNNTEPVYTIDGGELGQGDDALWFWRLVEMPGLFLGKNLMPAGLAEV